MKQTKLINNMIKNLIKIFIFTLVVGTYAQAFEISEEVLQAEQAVYKITTSSGNGTGFFIAPDLFVTNFHVIDEIKNLDEISLDHRNRPSIGILNIIAVSLFADIAVLQTEEESPVYLSEGELASLNENLVIMGYPSGVDTAELIKSTNDNSTWENIFYDTPTDFSGRSFGLSGSPLMNLDGEFLGVVCASSSNIKSSIISQYVSQLLEGHIGTICKSIDCIDQETQAIQKLIENQLRRGILENELTLFHHNPMLLKTFLNSEDIIAYLSLGAKEGSATAQYNLGVAYNEGDIVPQSFEQAVQLYRQAAQLGHAGATYNLGVKYDKGEGVPQSFEQAVQLYLQAAQLGHAGATYNLAAKYGKGEGVSQSFEQAVQLYLQAAQLGDAGAQNNLGIALYEGKGVEQDIPQAVFWLKKAAEQGDPNSQQALSRLYAHGVGVEKSVEKAKYWLDQSKKSQQQ